MKEFMLYIRNDGSELPAEIETEFLKHCESYIGNLQAQGKLIGAQPIGDEGVMLSNPDGNWSEAPYHESKDTNAGYYHIRATDLNDAIAIAKMNPEFVYRKTARIEVRSIKTSEETTGFVYPTE
jgi:hypothetical protein